MSVKEVVVQRKWFAVKYAVAIFTPPVCQYNTTFHHLQTGYVSNAYSIVYTSTSGFHWDVMASKDISETALLPFTGHICGSIAS